MLYSRLKCCSKNIVLLPKVIIARYCMNNFKIMAEDTLKIDENSNFISEGSATIIEPPGKKVFYNPVQEFNRDLSVLVLQTFSKELSQKWNAEDSAKKESQEYTILEALSATGLRSIRYAKEIPGVTKIIANDLSEYAIENMKYNIKFNKVENLVETSHSDACLAMYKNCHPSQRFQVIDLDPYGSPAPFLDAAVQSVSDGGILMVTCTDLAILCGNFPETCYVRYGALSLKTQSMHEMAVRIVLQNIQAHASAYKRHIVPILSLSVDFYIRVFVKVYTSPLACKSVTSKLALVYYCNGCDYTALQPLGIQKEKKGKLVNCLPHVPVVGTQCSFCNGKFHMGGPIWTGPLHDQKFITEMLNSEEINNFNTSKRLVGMLSMALEELYDVPLYYRTSQLSGILKCLSIPVMTIRSALKNGGYRVSDSHAAKESIKTDAPMSFIWDIFKEWVKKNPVNQKKIEPGSPADIILSTPMQHEIDLSLRPDASPLSKELKLTRYQVNPTAFWGPGSKSTTKTLSENPKKARNQNKNKRKRQQNNSPEDATKEPNLNSEVVN